MPKTKIKEFSGCVNVCAHNVDFRYWDFMANLTDELETELTEHAEERAQDCIVEGYQSGDLNYLYVNAKGEGEEIRGWWEINRD